ncbi:hypothetical protein BGZ73_008029 [Actinomortierella ambigua]|nr:hypothetical protein BGZ73_008029 [Actinomortierella ambigua]
MASSRFLDMALGDVVKQRSKGNRSPAGGGRRGGGGSGPGGGRNSGRSSPYQRPSSNDDKWSHDKFGQQEASTAGGKWKHDRFGGRGGQQGGDSISNENNPKIIVENLHYAVTLDDVKELFDTHAGRVKSADIKYDVSGRSTGVAYVVFEDPADAAKAIRKLNGIALDDQVMKISFAPLPVSRRSTTNDKPDNKKKDASDVFSRLGATEASIAARLGPLNRMPRTHAVSTPSPSASPAGSQTNQSGGNRGHNQRKNQSKPKPKPATAEDLDMEMDSYMGEASKA